MRLARRLRGLISLAVLSVGGLLPAPANAQPVQGPGTASPFEEPMDTPSRRAAQLPVVSDPMLESPPDLSRKIQSWADALALVRAPSPEYVTNFEAIRHAEAQTRMALASLVPALTGQGSYTHNFFSANVPFNGAVIVSPSPNVWTGAATAAWTPLNPRALYDYETAKKNVDVARLSFEDKRRQIAASVIGAILAGLSAARVAELNRVGLRSALERLHLTEARLQFGQGTPLDVDRAQEDVAAARRMIVDGDESLRRAHESLGVALGSRVPISVSSDLDLESFERAVAETCHLNDAVERRPDVTAARERLLVTERAATSAELAATPTLGIVSQGVYTSAPLLGPNGTLSVAAVVTIPLYDGGYRYGQLRDARAAEAQAAAQLEATRLNAMVSSARAMRTVDVLRADREIMRTERDLAERIDVRTRDAYARGRGTSLDLVTSAQALRLAEVNLAIVEFQLSEAQADSVLENAECTF